MNPNMYEMAAELHTVYVFYRLHERATMTELNIQEQDPLCT